MKINTRFRLLLVVTLLLTTLFSCAQPQAENLSDTDEIKKKANRIESITAKEILGNPKYLAMSYGGYRENTRDAQPTIEQLKEDMKILSAMGVGIVRTYNVQLKQAANLLEAIHQLREADPTFEMYVMLGAWIDCENAWTKKPNHDKEDKKANTAEINKAVELANKYPEIVKVIAVGNEAMVKWAATYFVQPSVILNWVNHLQDLKQNGGLPSDIWITSSDNYAAWGGEGKEYHVEDLNKLIEAVDYVSLHIYPMHETHYKPDFWGVFDGEEDKSKEEKIELAMQRAMDFGIAQYDRAAAYIKSLGIEKDIHIGETGWATSSNGFYGDEGTKATDEYKEGVFYKKMREWTAKNKMSCFYFEAFNENWKDEKNPEGSENYFGLFTIDGQAKYALWDLVEKGNFEGLTRGKNPIGKTYNGDKTTLMKAVKLPPKK
ncbi:MAG: glycosyl hydrolase family 17 protein [Saprospiraceae bacterium]